MSQTREKPPKQLVIPRQTIPADHPLIDALKATSVRAARIAAVQALGGLGVAAADALAGSRPELVFGFRTIAEVIWQEKRDRCAEAWSCRCGMDGFIRDEKIWRSLVDELRGLEQDAAADEAFDHDEGGTS